MGRYRGMGGKAGAMDPIALFVRSDNPGVCGAEAEGPVGVGIGNLRLEIGTERVAVMWRTRGRGEAPQPMDAWRGPSLIALHGPEGNGREIKCQVVI